ncbi:MAG: TetR/AcrR family transcriptional regulator [Myxococcales bacterium]|nr:TetR/AcrR family transcriptional regulator [Myxococcales bacterium]
MSREHPPTEPREQILDAAARLFAEKGYGGTGVREIAAEAGVALSMINYYFGSKQGVLEELLDRTQGRYIETVRRAFEDNDTLEARIHAWIHGAVVLARDNCAWIRVAFADLPREAPGVLEAKARRIKEVAALIREHILAPLGREADIPLLGPALGTMIMSHFMARPMVERILGALPDDDAFYERYARVIAEQILYGLTGRRPESSDP